MSLVTMCAGKYTHTHLGRGMGVCYARGVGFFKGFFLNKLKCFSLLKC